MTAPTLTTSNALKARLKLPPHPLSGPAARISRSKQFTRRLHEPYKLTLRAAKPAKPSTAGQSSSGSLFQHLWAMSEGHIILFHQ